MLSGEKRAAAGIVWGEGKGADTLGAKERASAGMLVGKR